MLGHDNTLTSRIYFLLCHADLCYGKTCSVALGSQCRSAGECDPATGTCSADEIDDDGEKCTNAGNKPGSCQDGSCITICSAGTGTSTCINCPLGYYSIGGNPFNPTPSCTKCPNGKTTANVGSTNVAACSVGLCNAGFGGSACSVCPVGKYSPGGTLASPKTNCISCQTGKTTAGTGSTGIAKCSLQICAAGRGGPNCQVCGAGYWAAAGTAANPQRACTKCASGKTTNNATGSISIAACA